MDYSRNSNIKARREHASNKKKVINKIGVIFFRVFVALVLVGGFAALGAGVGIYLGVIQNAPSVNVNIQPEIYTSIIYDSNGVNEIDRLKGDENRIYITSDKIPQDLKNAFVAIEDERFYQHDGVDVQGMIRAAVTMVQSGFKRTEGASTITQQLIKNNVNKLASNTFITKLQEQYMAVEYEKELVKQYNGDKTKAKDHILEVYINTINLGHGYYGAQTAAKNYFNKDVSQLTLSECAVLASITQNPSKNSPDNHPDNNRDREILVLNKMLDLGMISQEEHDAAMDDNVYDRVSTNAAILDETSSVHSYFVDALVQQLSSDIQTKEKVGAAEASNLIYNGGLQIWATQDAHMQQIVDNTIQDDSYFPANLFKIDIEYDITVTNKITGKQTNYTKKATVSSNEDVQPQIDAWKREILTADDDYTERTFIIPQPQVGMVIMDYHNGQVKAVSGGRGNKTDNRTFSRAVDSIRQPGSVFKILASYAPAIELGKIGPSTIYVDQPFTYNGYTPRNWWGDTYKGPETVRSAIEQSMNVIAVENLVNTGIEESFKILQRFHFTTLVEGEEINGQWFTDKTAAMALGGLTHGVTTLELTAAYAAIANGGFYNKPVFYSKVLNHDGTVLIDNTDSETNPPEEILKQSTAYILTDLMRGVIDSPQGTGRTAKFKTIDMPIAGKTGTTTDAKDLTFVGYTPYYVAGIWTGYDTPDALDTPNQHYHLDIWRDIMEEIHKNLEVKDFEKPPNVQMVYICMDSGKLATDFCWEDPRGNRVIETPYVNGDAPTEYCDIHGAVTIDTSTGMKATQYCPDYLCKTYYGIIVKDSDYTDPSYQIPESLYDAPYCTIHTHAVYTPPSNYQDNGSQPGDQQDQTYQDDTGPPSDGSPDQYDQSDQINPPDQTAPDDQTQPQDSSPPWDLSGTAEPYTAPDQQTDSDQTVVPPEFQNTEQLQPDTPPDQSGDNGNDSQWIEPSANPSQDSLGHIDDQNNPVIDQPAQLDDFTP